MGSSLLKGIEVVKKAFAGQGGLVPGTGATVHELYRNLGLSAGMASSGFNVANGRAKNVRSIGQHDDKVRSDPGNAGPGSGNGEESRDGTIQGNV